MANDIGWLSPKMRHLFSHSPPRVAPTELQRVNLDTMTFLHNLRCPPCTRRRQRLVANKMKTNINIERGRWFGVHLRPLGLYINQDHTSQDHFCSLIDEFLTRNLDSDQPRWRVETTGSERETVAKWMRSACGPVQAFEDRSASLNTCRWAGRDLSGPNCWNSSSWIIEAN